MAGLRRLQELSQSTITRKHILLPVTVRRITVELETREIITVPFPQIAVRGKRFRTRRVRGRNAEPLRARLERARLVAVKHKRSRNPAKGRADVLVLEVCGFLASRVGEEVAADSFRGV